MKGWLHLVKVVNRCIANDPQVRLVFTLERSDYIYIYLLNCCLAESIHFRLGAQ